MCVCVSVMSDCPMCNNRSLIHTTHTALLTTQMQRAREQLTTAQSDPGRARERKEDRQNAKVRACVCVRA
jgi:hypothetical protein